MGTAVRTEGLRKTFGSVEAVRGLDLEVREGEVFGFLGPNGAGKTTSLRMMTGLLRPSAGSTRILDVEVRPGGGKAASLLGVAPQENVLWEELTSIENLLVLGELHGLPRREARRRGRELLSLLGLAEKEKARAGSLSGGMKRRLNIAMALVHDPPVLFLDEPEAGLDPQARVVVREFLKGLARKKTVVVTTHNMDEAERVADRVGIIDHGRLIALDTPQALKTKIGSGDVFELKVAGDPERVAERLRLLGLGDVHVVERTVHIRGLDLPKRFPAIIAEVGAAGAAIEDARYRGNSLEDVFIALTGRNLRE